MSDRDGADEATARPTRAAHERETSIRRGIEVLLSLGGEEAVARGGLGVTRISELLGREKSQVSRALKALAEYGLAERDGDGAYRLGWRLYALAELAGEPRLVELATPLMRQLATTFGERVHLSVRQGTEALTIVTESAGRSVEAVGWAGRLTPVYCTSTGRALILDWTREEIVETFSAVEFAARGPRTVTSPAALADAVASARAQGQVVVDGEFEPDLLGLAVPIRGPSGAIIAALNLSAPRFRLIDRVDAAAAALATTAAQLMAVLAGGTAGTPDAAGVAGPGPSDVGAPVAGAA